MKTIPALLAGLLLTVGLASTDSAAAADQPAPIHFGAISWESGALTTEILRLIVERGYGYPTDTLPGSTVSMEVALARNDLQVIAEEWAGRSPAWVKAEQAGQVFALGDTVKNAEEGWWVPAYVIEGDPARGIKPSAPDLRQVQDLKRYPQVFRDPESPDKGRFLNSPSGWTSETVNSQKLKAYGLNELYTNFRSGSGAAMDAEITSAIRRGQPVLFYYWNPTPSWAVTSSYACKNPVRCQRLGHPHRCKQPQPPRQPVTSGEIVDRGVQGVSRWLSRPCACLRAGRLANPAPEPGAGEHE